jgi:hypothetical protein
MDTREARKKINEQKVKATIQTPPEKKIKMEDGQRWHADAIYGKREPVTWHDYKQGFRFPFYLLNNAYIG